mmetsp:Transcript_101699/g.323139  ORF Transcript_101699/g.323139 Transcript_101699/m.323139 type:complete len:762 (+) Transcript_101699:133-2418(+)
MDDAIFCCIPRSPPWAQRSRHRTQPPHDEEAPGIRNSSCDCEDVGSSADDDTFEVSPSFFQALCRAPRAPSCSPGRPNKEGNRSSRSAAPHRSASSVSHEVEWLTWVVKEIWPYFNEALRRHVKEFVEPALQENTGFKALRFTGGLHLGDEAPVLGPVDVRRRTAQEHPGIECDVGVRWDTAVQVGLEIPGVVSFGIRRLRVTGEASIILRPLMPSLPVVAGIQLFMISPPEIEWEFSGAARLGNWSWVSSSLKSTVLDLICQHFVLPNRKFIHWIWGREEEVDITALYCPMPECLLRLGIVEARGLEGKDVAFLRPATSNPYAVVRLGNQSYRTNAQKRTLTPKWGSSGWFDIMVLNFKQLVQVEVFDANLLSRNDALGRLRGTTVEEVLRSSGDWFDLTTGESNASHRGRNDGSAPRPQVRLEAVMYKLVRSVEQIQRPPAAVMDCKGTGKEVPSARTKAILVVEVRASRGLPRESATGAVVTVEVEGQTYKTPGSRWEEPLQDLTYGPNVQEVDPAAQRLAECLSSRHNVCVEEIANVSGLDAETLQQVLQQKPSFTTRWNHAFNIPLRDVGTAAIRVTLRLPPANSKAAAFELKNAFEVERLLGQGVETTPQSLLMYDGMLPLEPTDHSVQADGKKTAARPLFRGHVDLDVCFRLYGLQLHRESEPEPSPCVSPDRSKCMDQRQVSETPSNSFIEVPKKPSVRATEVGDAISSKTCSSSKTHSQKCRQLLSAVAGRLACRRCRRQKKVVTQEAVGKL